MSNDATCPNCGADNLDDYPVCAACAIKCHFPARENCRHCAASASVNNLVATLREVRNSPIQRVSFRGNVTITIPRITWTRMSRILSDIAMTETTSDKIKGGGNE